jgi:hypothetical protein
MGLSANQKRSFENRFLIAAQNSILNGQKTPRILDELDSNFAWCVHEFKTCDQWECAHHRVGAVIGQSRKGWEDIDPGIYRTPDETAHGRGDIA